MGDFKKLAVWEKAHQLTLHLYRVTNAFPKAELFGLTSQIRRACASIGANLAEGSGRHRDTEFGRFLLMAIGSASELEYHIILARDLGYMSIEDFAKVRSEVHEVGRMLVALYDRVHKSKLVERKDLIAAE